MSCEVFFQEGGWGFSSCMFGLAAAEAFPCNLHSKWRPDGRQPKQTARVDAHMYVFPFLADSCLTFSFKLDSFFSFCF